jgi:hypothetical protein
MGNEVSAKGPISVTLPIGEAMYALDALSVASAKAWTTVRRLTQTQAPVDEREIAEMAATYLDRAHKRLDGALFPVCRYLQEDDCTWPVTAYDERGVPYCENHYARIVRIREAYPR